MNLLPIHLRTIAQPVVKTYFNSPIRDLYTLAKMIIFHLLIVLFMLKFFKVSLVTCTIL